MVIVIRPENDGSSAAEASVTATAMPIPTFRKPKRFLPEEVPAEAVAAVFRKDERVTPLVSPHFPKTRDNCIVDRVCPYGILHLVVTGGEPFSRGALNLPMKPLNLLGSFRVPEAQ
jgi:hypothetical protein